MFGGISSGIAKICRPITFLLSFTLRNFPFGEGDNPTLTLKLDFAGKGCEEN